MEVFVVIVVAVVVLAIGQIHGIQPRLGLFTTLPPFGIVIPNIAAIIGIIGNTVT
jgi:hypothetical protein